MKMTGGVFEGCVARNELGDKLGYKMQRKKMMKNKIRFVLLTTIVFVGQLFAADITNTFQEGVSGYTGTRDTRLQKNNPDTNYESGTILPVGTRNWNGDEDRYLLKWDVSAIPTTASILDAYAVLVQSGTQ